MMGRLLLSTPFACRGTSDTRYSSARMCLAGRTGPARPERPSESLPDSISKDNSGWCLLEKDLSPPSQPSCVALLRDTWQWSLGCLQQLRVAHSQGCEGWRDEDASSCLCYCDLLQDRAREHTPASLECCSQVCHGHQSLGEPEESVCLVLTFIAHFYQLFWAVWCSSWWQCSFILGFPHKHVGCLQKFICHPASRGKVGTSEYFHK